MVADSPVVATPAVVGSGATAVPLQASDWWFVVENGWYLLGGTVLTIVLSIVCILVGFLAGFPAGAVAVYGGSVSRRLVENVGVVLRGTPIVVIFFFTYFVFGTPGIDAGAFEISAEFVAAVLGLGLRSAAYQAEMFRGALQSVDDGQLEAARSVGMGKWESVGYVAVPQALRRSVPSFQNEATIVLKDTSVVFAIGLSELLTRSYDLFTRETTATLEVILTISAIYFALTFVTNRGLDYVESVYRIPGGESA
jgi:polar amino acid transport system permease protein